MTDKKELILDAATAVFAQKGFHKATIHAIAQEAGIADGTIYNYFANKTDLLVGLLHRLNESEQRPTDMAGFTDDLSATDSRALMLAYLRQRLALIFTNKTLFRALLPEIIVNDALRQLYFDNVLAPTMQLGEQSVAALRPDVDPVLLARTMAATTFGLLLLHLLGDETTAVRLDDLAELIVDQTLKQ